MCDRRYIEREAVAEKIGAGHGWFNLRLIFKGLQCSFEKALIQMVLSGTCAGRHGNGDALAFRSAHTVSETQADCTECHLN